MSAQTVSLFLRTRRPDGTRPYLPAVMTLTGRLKPLYAIVDGEPTHTPDGVYYLRYRQGGQRIWERVGTDAPAALTAKKLREHALAGASLGLEAAAHAPVRLPQPKKPVAPARVRKPLLPTIHAHCRAISLLRGERTAASYDQHLMTFASGCGKQYLDELTREDIQAYVLRESQRGMRPKTVSNRLTTLAAFLRKHGEDASIINKLDLPRVHKKLPHVYTRTQVKALLEVSSAEDRLIWEVFLKAGLREQELSHLGWEDVVFERGLLHLHAKPDLRWNLKDAEERQIPLPQELMEQLRVRRAEHPKARLVFPAADGKPDGHLLRRLKKVVYRAGLNCGLCTNRAGQLCSGKPVCGRWTLHSFRRTCATFWHEAGLSVPTVQRLLGHSDVETTMSYLGIQDFGSADFRGMVESAFAAVA